VTDIHRERLDTSKPGDKRAAERKEPLPKECGRCSFLMAPKVSVCPACGHKREVRSDLEERDGELVEVGKVKIDSSKAEKQRWFSGLLWLARHRGYRDGWAAQKYRTRFGVWPRGLSEASAEPGPDIQGWVKHQQIKWAKAKAKRE